jgi:hypothetical protein
VCRGRARLAGVVRSRRAARAAETMNIYGAQGLVMLEYTGTKTDETHASVYTGIKYPYYPGRQFYVDANDVSRIVAWQENGRVVFEPVNNGNSG